MESKKWKYFLYLIIANIFTSIQSVLLAFLVRLMIDSSLIENKVVWLEIIGLILFMLTLLYLDYYFYYLVDRTTNELSGSIRLKMFHHLTYVHMKFYDSYSSGDIMSRLINDIKSLEESYGRHIKNIISSILGGFIALITIFILDWRMGLATLMIGISFGITNTLFTPKFRNIAEQLQHQLGSFTSLLSNILYGIKTIKLFNLYKYHHEKIINDNHGIYLSSVKQTKTTGILEGLNLLLTYVSTVGLLAFGILLTSQGNISIGTVVAIVFLTKTVTSSFLFTGNFISQLQQSLISTVRLNEILHYPQEYKQNKKLDYLHENNNLSSSDIIQMFNIQFSYHNNNAVIQDLSLSIKKGEVVALVGPSGSGKSTIFKLLLGFYPSKEGLIFINGQNIKDYSLTELRELIAYVPQDPILFNTSIEENIRLGNVDAPQESIIEAARRAYAHDFILKLPKGYSTIVNEGGSNLSGGQRQRIAIARALLKNAPILLLDEATSSLDAHSEMLVKKALDQLMKNKTTLIIAHRLETIQNADRIVVINKGKIEESGTHDELINKNGLYKSFLVTDLKE